MVKVTVWWMELVFCFFIVLFISLKLKLRVTVICNSKTRYLCVCALSKNLKPKRKESAAKNVQQRKRSESVCLFHPGLAKLKHD